jgi:hypothetical protein
VMRHLGGGGGGVAGRNGVEDGPVLANLGLACFTGGHSALIHECPKRVALHIDKLPDDVCEQGVAASRGEFRMKAKTESDEFSDRAGVVDEELRGVDVAGELGDAVRVDARGGQLRGHRLDRAPRFDEVPRRPLKNCVASAPDLGHQASHEGAVTVPHLDRADQLQGEQRFTGGRARDIRSRSDFSVRRQPISGGVFAPRDGGHQVLSDSEIPALLAVRIRGHVLTVACADPPGPTLGARARERSRIHGA